MTEAKQKIRLTPAQKKALAAYNEALRQEDRLGFSVFANSVNVRRQEEKTREKYDACLRLGMTWEHGL